MKTEMLAVLGGIIAIGLWVTLITVLFPCDCSVPEKEVIGLLTENELLKDNVASLEIEQDNLLEEKEYLQKVNLNLKNEREDRVRAVIDCYWATSYLSDYEGTLEHFDGYDYKDEYVNDCLINVWDDWETIIGDKPN